MHTRLDRRRFVGIFGAASAAALLAACSSSTPAMPAAGASKPTDTKPADAKSGAAGPAQSSGGPVTLRVLTPSFPQDSGKQVFEEIIAGFKQSHPSVSFDVEYLPNFSDLNERLSTNFAAGTPPDVFMIGLGWIEAFAARNQLLPIDDRVTPAELDDFYPVLREGGTFGGKLYSLPIQLDTRLLLYRKDHFVEAGLDSEKPPTSWEQFADYAVKLTKRGADGSLDRTGFDPLGGSNAQPRQHFFRFFWQNGAQLFNKENTEALFNSPEAVEALRWYVDLVRGRRVYDLEFTTGQPTVSLLGAGKASMASAHNDIWRELRQNGDLDQIGIIPPLKRKEQGEFIGGNYVVIARQTKHPDEAWQFMEHLSSRDMTLKGDVVRGAVPPRKSLQEAEYVKSNPILSAAMAQLAVARREGGPERWLEIRSLWDPALVEALQGQKDPKQALDDLTRKSTDILKRA